MQGVRLCYILYLLACLLAYDGKAEGGYFLVAETDGRSDVEFCQALADAKGVVATPMSPFYATPFAEDEPCRLVRLTVCKSREHVQRACDALSGGGAV
jgi:aspartate/methionine/tyrosine aminotransferase